MARPLKIFMRGKNVRVLQELLKRQGFSIQDQVGMFGTYTRDAVKTIQKQKKLKITGIVDDDLMQFMQQGIAPTVKDTAKQEHQLPVNIVNQAQLDGLIRLMIRKGLIDADELETEINGSQSSKALQTPREMLINT